MSQEQIVSTVKEKQAQIEVLSIRAKTLYIDNEALFQASKGIRTSQIEENYKQINSTFNAKSKLEGEVNNLKKELMKLVMGE